MADVFLSYGHEDLVAAKRCAKALEHEGFSVWWDSSLRSGEAFDATIEKELKAAKAVVVLWSRTSVESRWVRAEATLAEKLRTLVPVLIEPCDLPIMFQLTHMVDLSRWKGEASDSSWQAFLGDVGRFVRKEGAGASPEAAEKVVPPTRRSGLHMLIAVFALLLVGPAMFWIAGRLPKAASKQSETVAVAPDVVKEVTLAVLPFADYSTAHDQEAFSDGLSEEILNQVAQIKGLTVTARTSSFSFKGKNEDMRVIAEKLGVANLLEGSIRKEGNQLRITAQLINGNSGAHMWSKTYSRELKGIFAVQEEIAKDVAQALSIKLDVSDMNRANGGTTDIEAYDKYLHALALLSQDSQRKAVQQAVDLLREAVSLDPQFLRGWELLIGALNGMIFFSPENEAALRNDIATAEDHAVASSPNGRAAQVRRWTELMAQRKWSEAEAAANAIDRTFQDTGPLSGILSTVGRNNEVLAEFERRVRLDPLSLSASTDLQLMLDKSGRRADAQVEFERSKQLEGNHARSEFLAMWRLMARKDLDRASVQKRFRATMTGNNVPLVIDSSLADSLGDNAHAGALVRKAFEDPANQQSLRMTLIAMYAGMFSDRELVLAALRRGIFDLRGAASDVWMPYEPGLRADPGFKDLVRKMGLVDYWRASGKWGDFCKPVGKDDFECH